MLLLLAACLPGHLDFGGGSEALQTALFRVDPSARTRTVLLSNGRIPCDLDAVDDPQQRALQLLEITTAACREGARHVLLELYASPDVGWEGDYPIALDATLENAILARGRQASARYFEVIEAELVIQDGLARQYHVADSVQIQATHGRVSLKRADTLASGSFFLPEALADGSFRASACPEDSAVFAVIEAAPFTSCP